MTTEMQTETTKAAWADAAAASAAAQEPGDPPPKRFRARLTTKLTDREFREHGQKLADITAELDEFESETKQIMADRKATKAEIDGRRRRELQILSTGREDRDVDCVEHVSIRQGRKWRVRLDTKETYDEEPLDEGERQASLPMELVHPDDPEDGQLRVVEHGFVGSEHVPGEVDSDEGALDEARKPLVDVLTDALLPGEDGTDVTDPEALLEAAEKGDDDAPANAPKGRGGRKPRGESKA